MEKKTKENNNGSSKGGGLLKYIVPGLILLITAGAIGTFLLYQETKIPEPINPYRKGVVIGNSEMAQKVMEDMTLEEKVGQLFVTPYRDDGSDLDALSNYHIGGIIYTGTFFEDRDPEQAAGVFKGMYENTYIKPFQCVAEEGEAYTAVSKWPAFRPSPYKLPRALYDESGLEGVLNQEEEKLLFLRRMGLNLNFGPITNIVTNPGESLYEQTLGQPKEIASEYIKRLVLLYDEIGMSSVLRYYSGDNTEAFMDGCYMGAPSIMMSNKVVASAGSVDKNRPISLSKKWHTYLREELGFEGVIIISDIDSHIFDEYLEEDKVAVAAIKAGNNMIWATNYEGAINDVLEAVENGTLEIADINDSVSRVLTWKIRYGLLDYKD